MSGALNDYDNAVAGLVKRRDELLEQREKINAELEQISKIIRIQGKCDGNIKRIDGIMRVLRESYGPVRLCKIAESLGVNQNDIWGSLKNAQSSGRVVRVGRGLYTLPDDESEAKA